MLTTLITWVLSVMTGLLGTLLCAVISDNVIVLVPPGTPDMLVRTVSTIQSPFATFVILIRYSGNSNVSTPVSTLGESPPLLVVAFPLFYVHQLRIRHAL